MTDFELLKKIESFWSREILFIAQILVQETFLEA